MIPMSKAIQRARLSPNFNRAVAEQLMITTVSPDVGIPADAKPTGSRPAMPDLFY